METFVQNIYLTKREKLRCSYCKKPVRFGEAYVAETENHRGTCFTCSPFVKTTFLEPGNAALTRRSKKHSSVCGILFQWNKRRRRFERKGQYVEAKAIELAQKECEADAQKRAVSNEKAAIKRAAEDKIYITEFSKAIRKLYPSCPKNREVAIAKHACEKYSGRVGRSANAKQFDKAMIDLAVEAHIRHKETNYDSQFNKGITKRNIRSNVKQDIIKILQKWRRPLG